MSAIDVHAVSKQYGAVRAIDNVELRIERGEILGLIGHNGAGKSTLFRMMLGLERPTAGTINVQGVPTGSREFRAVRRHVGYLPENVVLYDNLNALETLAFFARLKRSPQQQCRQLIAEVGLEHAALRPVREYSRGMRQRLGFAQALLGSPQLLFLDEPTTGLDPQASRDLHQRLRGLRDQGVTIVITSHVLAELQERVDRLAVLANGQLQALGSIQELRARTQLPIAIDLELAADDVVFALGSLQALPDLQIDRTPEGLQLRCAESRRMPVLAAVATLGQRVRRLRIREPSLEDVFLGHVH
jgi:Cu-processing system ATP-binding protein